MRIIFVRHAEPDYEKDSLTENGRKEAEALAVRTKNWTDIDRFYCSPLGRAVETAAPTLKVSDQRPAHGRDPRTLGPAAAVFHGTGNYV